MSQQKIIKHVATNERGMRIGESHHNNKHPNDLVNQVRDMREIEGLSYGVICRRLDLPKSTVATICRYERRAQTVARWKQVETVTQEKPQ